MDFNLIESINPFAGAYDFLSKSINPNLLNQIQVNLAAKREKMNEKKVRELWPYINEFIYAHGRKPHIDSNNDFERRLAIAYEYARELKRKQNSKAKASGNL